MKRPQHGHQWALIALGVGAAALLLVLPLVVIFTQALSGGGSLLAANLSEGSMRHALGLALLVAVLTVPVNLVFGIALAWCVTQDEFRGRRPPCWRAWPC